jgi:hypothetical protein
LIRKFLNRSWYLRLDHTIVDTAAARYKGKVIKFELTMERPRVSVCEKNRELKRIQIHIRNKAGRKKAEQYKQVTMGK